MRCCSVCTHGTRSDPLRTPHDVGAESSISFGVEKCLWQPGLSGDTQQTLQVVSKVEQSGGAGTVNSLEPGKERRGFVVSMPASGQNSRSCGEA